MKCVRNIVTGEIKRISDERATAITKDTNWLFCPKSDWKSIRDGKTLVTLEIPKEEVSEKISEHTKTNKKVKKSGKNKGEVK